MKQPRDKDSDIVAHARRELEMAGLFTADEESGYDGFIGRAALTMIKLYSKWVQDDAAKGQAVRDVFYTLATKDILSHPTDDPDEWEDRDVEGIHITCNRRNEFYITKDGRKTWYNLRSQKSGVCIDHTTGEPLEGISVDDGKVKSNKTKTSSGNYGHGNYPDKTTKTAGVAERFQGVEGAELNAGVESESKETSSEAQTGTEKSQGRKA